VIVCALTLATPGLQAQTARDNAQACPRPEAGGAVKDPPELRSRNGLLEVTLHFRYQATLMNQGPPRYCYGTDDGMESPTLRVHPGDTLIIHLHNDLPQTSAASTSHAMAMLDAKDHDGADGDCSDGPMSASVTNLHFHGLNISPTCHQDDVVHTLIQPGQDFTYKIPIPRDEPAGLYWYHPHPHGYGERQLQGGASGALIVEGSTKDASIARLTERVLVLRDQPRSDLGTLGTDIPAWDMSLNYVPVTYPEYRPAKIETPAGERELWRVLNAGADTIFDLQVLVNREPQPLRMVAIDGVPINSANGTHAPTETSVLLPPGARAEFVVRTPRQGEQAELVTKSWDTGPEGDRDPSRPIAEIVSHSGPAGGSDTLAAAAKLSSKNSRTQLQQEPVVQRRLYFSQVTPNPMEPDASIFYFVTVVGQKPETFKMGGPPNIVVHEGDVEDWTVENRSREDHVFHIHQVHFRVLEIDGKPTNDPTMRDTIDLPYWSGSGPYPSVKLRLDFRDPKIVGTFLYHCHILKHEDMGMMGEIEVLPAGIRTETRLSGATHAEIGTVIPLTAEVIGGKGSTPGTVQFAVDGIEAGKPVPLSQGRAEFTTSFETGGIHQVTASYSGDHTYDESISRSFKIKVKGLQE
jgi:FtsP/CotA-like multicopper oxidase with cupredoxin domain